MLLLFSSERERGTDGEASRGRLRGATALARRLATGPGLAIGMTKKMVWHEWPMDLDAAIELAGAKRAMWMRPRTRIGLPYRDPTTKSANGRSVAS